MAACMHATAEPEVQAVVLQPARPAETLAVTSYVWKLRPATVTLWDVECPRLALSASLTTGAVGGGSWQRLPVRKSRRACHRR